MSTDDNLEMRMIYGSQTEDDIILEKEIRHLADKYPDRFRVHFIVDNPKRPDEWEGGVGYITDEMMQRHLFPPSDDSLMLYCGNPGMKKSVFAMAKRLGYDMTT